jgi:hypothetical protein
MGNDASRWLLVPMEVSALVVGQDPKDDKTDKLSWSDLSPDYSRKIPTVNG